MSDAVPQTASRAASRVRVPALDRVLFMLLLALVASRPLISESYERLELSFLPRNAGGVTPANTVWLDSLTLIAAVGILARSWAARRGGGWVLVGIGALMIAVAWSTFWAGEKRLALNAGFGLVIAVLAGAALVQVMRAPWMPRLLLAALLASGAAMATKCVLWKAFEHRDTLEAWAEHKSQLAAAGQDLDAPQLVNFERRLQSGEAIGYQSNPNVTGSFLMMWLLAAGGVCAGWLAAGKTAVPVDRSAAIALSAALVLLLGLGLWFTQSTGALVSLLGGLVLLVVLGTLRLRVAIRPGRTLAVLMALYVGLIAAGAIHGFARGTLPHPSLAFRWHYWTAAVRALADTPLSGAGRLNFADAYMRYKSALSPEEVRDPHNLWLSLLVELGPLGLVAGAVLLMGAIPAVLRRLDGRVGEDARRPVISIYAVVAAMIAFTLMHLLLSGQVESGATAVLWGVNLAAVWLLTFVLAARLVDMLPDSEAARGWLLAGLAAAVLAALLHAMIDFALLIPGGLYLFVALLAVALGYRPPAVWEGPRPRWTWLPGVAGLLLVSIHISGVTLPTMRCEFWRRQLQYAAFNHTLPAAYPEISSLQALVLECDPLDSDAARDVARMAALVAAQVREPPLERVKLLKRAEQLAELALERNPQSRAAHATLGRLYQDLEEAYLLAVHPDEAAEATHKAAQHWQRAVELYPTDPRGRISAAKAWFDWWHESEDPAAARLAAEHFQAALEIDAARPAEEVMRLRPAEREEIDRYMSELPQ